MHQSTVRPLPSTSESATGQEDEAGPGLPVDVERRTTLGLSN